MWYLYLYLSVLIPLSGLGVVWYTANKQSWSDTTYIARSLCTYYQLRLSDWYATCCTTFSNSMNTSSLQPQKPKVRKHLRPPPKRLDIDKVESDKDII